MGDTVYIVRPFCKVQSSHHLFGNTILSNWLRMKLVLKVKHLSRITYCAKSTETKL